MVRGIAGVDRTCAVAADEGVKGFGDELALSEVPPPLRGVEQLGVNRGADPDLRHSMNRV